MTPGPGTTHSPNVQTRRLSTPGQTYIKVHPVALWDLGGRKLGHRGPGEQTGP